MQNKSKLAGTQYLAMTSVWLIAGLLIGIIGLNRYLNYYSSHALVELELLIPVVVILIIDRFEVMRGIPMKPIGIKVILWTLLLTVLLLPLVYFLNLVSQLFVPNHVLAELFQYAQAGQNVYDYPIWLNLLYMAVLPGVVEEYLFRGVLAQGFRRCGLLKTALLTALMFGLVHGNLNQFLYVFAVGIFFIYLDSAAGSIYASMLSHTLLNSVMIFLVYAQRLLPENLSSALIQIQSDTASVRQFGPLFWIIFGMIAGAAIVLCIVVIRQVAKAAGREVQYAEERKGAGRLKGKEGRTFSVELLIGLIIPVVYIAIMMIRQLVSG